MFDLVNSKALQFAFKMDTCNRSIQCSEALGTLYSLVILLKTQSYFTFLEFIYYATLLQL